MKKVLTITIAIVLALTMAACSKTAPENKIIGSVDMSNSGANSNPTDFANLTSYYGKVSLVAGNELSVNLAKFPENSAPDESLPKLEDGAIGAFTITTPAVAAGEANPDAAGAQERTELEYTGENKDFIIPAGLEIKDANGSVKQLSDIKKGTVLNIFQDKDGNIIEVLYIA